MLSSLRNIETAPGIIGLALIDTGSAWRGQGLAWRDQGPAWRDKGPCFKNKKIIKNLIK